LEKVIAATFQHQDSQLETDIFTSRGPLSDLESKILIADAFRLAPRIEFYIPLLHSIRRIRNAFAHSILDMDFDTKEVTDELETHLLPYIRGQRPGETLTNKQAFALAAFDICVHLDLTHEDLTGHYLFDWGPGDYDENEDDT
jgi:hypothetical protein